LLTVTVPSLSIYPLSSPHELVKIKILLEVLEKKHTQKYFKPGQLGDQKLKTKM